jgi:hypothetical protein
VRGITTVALRARSKNAACAVAAPSRTFIAMGPDKSENTVIRLTPGYNPSVVGPRAVKPNFMHITSGRPVALRPFPVTLKTCSGRIKSD